MVLCDRDIKKRLKTPEELDLPKNFLDLIKRQEMPKTLRDALDDKGWIIMDPIPPDSWFDADSVDVAFGHVVEMSDHPLEVVTIEGKEVIRRFTHDFRWDGSPKRLDNVRKVTRTDGSRIRFLMEKTDTLELQPGMKALPYTQQVVCVPFDLQMTIGGRSKFARNFVTAHVSSPTIHPGFCGHVVMEVNNTGDCSINLYPGLAFGSVGFNVMSGKPDTPYCDKQSPSFSGQR